MQLKVLSGSPGRELELELERDPEKLYAVDTMTRRS